MDGAADLYAHPHALRNGRPHFSSPPRFPPLPRTDAPTLAVHARRVRPPLPHRAAPRPERRHGAASRPRSQPGSSLRSVLRPLGAALPLPAPGAASVPRCACSWGRAGIGAVHPAHAWIRRPFHPAGAAITPRPIARPALIKGRR